MSFEKWGYSFEGTFTSCSSLKKEKGVYVIWCSEGGELRVLDAGEAENIKEKVCRLCPEDCWIKNCKGKILYSAAYMPEATEEYRKVAQKLIRNSSGPPCNEK